MGLSKEEIKKISGQIIEDYQLKEKTEAKQKRQKNENPQSFDKKAHNNSGIYHDIEQVTKEAERAQQTFSNISLEQRKKIIENMREAALKNAAYLGKLGQEETGFGKSEDKKQKNILAAEKTPGLEDLSSTTYTGDEGLTLIEEAPYGVIGAITPSTNPSSTIINNSIGMIAAGNTVVYNPHPGAKKVSLETINILNKAIRKSGLSVDLLFAPTEPTVETSQKLMNHPVIRILVVTGGERVVEIAMKTGKKVIAAGPGNPPVIVDDTAGISKTARDIVDGASFDNNVLCIAEKEVFVIEEVADLLINNMKNYGCYLAQNQEINRILNTVLNKNDEGNYVPEKKFVGKDASYILKESGIKVDSEYKLVIAEVDENHPFVLTEKLMPVLPIVRVGSLETAIEMAKNAEGYNYHTAIMHSENVKNMSRAAKSLNTTIFVKNAPSYAGLGIKGEGFTTLTIATPTGEGLTSARDFTRERRCTLSGAFRIT